MSKFKWCFVIIIIQIIASFYLGLSLAEDAKIPCHWNIKGEIDGYFGKWTGVLLFPGINLAMLLFIMALPYISVRYKNAQERFEKVIPGLAKILVLFFAGIHIYMILLAKEILNPNGNMIFYLIGLMFIMLGNLLPKIPSNFFAGIRTPWTLSSEEVWRKTHRLGGINFVIAGLLMIVITAVFGNNSTANIIMFVLFMSLVLYPVLYSFILYKKEEKK
ncbi:MAG: SdpI family protein [Candidatus Cloacimonetes bacterium]|nr:SdpI family protein [Candidatus Cloacimonadota bacterium]